MFSEFDRLAMTRALALAERGLDTTHPNPRVGCVIARGDRIIGEGFHERAGEPHAEVMALRSAKEPVAGATAYVTLEPCSHHGRTPPCVNALIEARIARVVFAVQDPNPRVSGQGADALLRAGITVEAGLMQNEATELNIGFMKRMKEGLPWVRVKLAMSLDGRTALANGASQWITGEPARADVQRWRARCSAVMTGVGTVLADDPLLNVRVAGFKGRQPLRVVLDARLRSPVGAKLFGAKPAAVGGGDVVIFAAVDGGLAAGLGGAGVVHSSRLPGDMAELVDAFEKSPTSVAAREDTVAGPASVKADGRAAVVGSAGAAAKTTSVASEKIAPASREAVPGTVMDLDRPAASAAPTGNWSVRTPVATVAAPEASVGAGEAAPGVSPPTVAAAGDVRGVEPNSDDATWAGAALSGAIPVSPVAKPEVANAAGPTAASEPKVTSEAKGISEAKTTSGGGAKGASAPTYEAFAARAALIAYANIGDTVLIPRSPANVTPDSSTGTTAGLPGGASVGVLGGAAAATKDAAAQAPGANAPAAPSAPLPTPLAPSPAPVSAAPMTAGSVSAAPVGAGSVSAGRVNAGSESAGPVSARSVGAGSVSAGPSTAALVSARPTGSAAGAAVARDAGPAKAAGKGDSVAAFQERRAALVAKGVRIEEVPSDEGFLDLFAVLKKLGEMEINEVLVEAGPTLAGQLISTFLVDELLLYVAPKLLGPQGRPLVNLPELQSLQDAWGFSLFDAKRFGDDLRLRMRPK